MAAELSAPSTECEDGFRPGNTGPVTRIADVRCADPGFFSVFDDVIPAGLARQAYEFTCAQEAPWGTFVPLGAVMGEGTGMAAEVTALDYGRGEGSDLGVPAAMDDPLPLATALLRCLFAKGGAAHARAAVEAARPCGAYGFAVWALASPAGTEVPYHLDYVEQHRLATNVIHCPLIAGTLQLSPGFHPEGEAGAPGCVPMDGGVFSAALEGIEHYRRFGHRLRLSSAEALAADMAADAAPTVEGAEATVGSVCTGVAGDDNGEEERGGGGGTTSAPKQRWLHVPYRSNRATVHDGALPHLSSRVGSLPAGTHRVIMGLNLFDARIGPTVARVPIHSYAFKRTEKLAAVFGKLCVGKEGMQEGQSAKGAGMKLSDLAAFAREKGAQHPMSKFLLKVAKALTAQEQETAAVAVAATGGGGGTGVAAKAKAVYPHSSKPKITSAAKKAAKPPATPLQAAFRAVMADDVPALRTLLESGAVAPDATNRGGDTLAFLAAERGRTAVLAFLNTRLEEPKLPRPAAAAATQFQ